MTRSSNCSRCIHYRKMKKGEVPTCSAFPDFIPKEVFSERIPHHKKMENQCGDFVFEPHEKDRKRYKEYFEIIDELTSKRSQFEQEVILIAKEILERINIVEKKKFVRGEIRLYRGESRMIKKVDEVLFFDNKENAELISIGFNSVLFMKLKNILFIESIENHKTDLEFIINYSGDYQLIFANHTRKERQNMNNILSQIQKRKARETLVKKGFVLISSKKLEEEIRSIFNTDRNSLNDRQIVERLHEKRYAVIWSDIYEMRKKLGLKTKREIRLEKKRPK